MKYGLDIYLSMHGKFPADDYVANTVKMAEDSDRLGFTGALIHFNHRVPDPWTLATLLLQHSTSFVPMLAVQPYYMPPLALAKKIASIAYLHGRRVALNMVVGSTPGELLQVCDTFDHDSRYERMDEYLAIVLKLLSNAVPLTHRGPAFEYSGLEYFAPGMDPALVPKVFMAGSSPVAMETAARHGAVALTNPTPIESFGRQYAGLRRGTAMGVRFGLIARETSEEAWASARRYYPRSRVAQINVRLNGRASDSNWRKDLSELASQETYDGMFWLGAVLAGASHSPFLVGSYDEVSKYLSGYVQLGVKSIILASHPDELDSNAEVLARIKLPEHHMDTPKPPSGAEI